MKFKKSNILFSLHLFPQTLQVEPSFVLLIHSGKWIDEEDVQGWGEALQTESSLVFWNHLSGFAYILFYLFPFNIPFLFFCIFLRRDQNIASLLVVIVCYFLSAWNDFLNYLNAPLSDIKTLNLLSLTVSWSCWSKRFSLHTINGCNTSPAVLITGTTVIKGPLSPNLEDRFGSSHC